METKYNYQANVVADVRQWMDDNAEYIEGRFGAITEDSRDDAEQWLYDEMFTSDSVTGNGSGSYTFNTWQAEDLLRRFFEGIQTGVTLGGYSYMTGKMHESIKMAEKQSWEEWDKIENGIAWRGGAGYHYTIFEDVKEENKLQTA